MGRHPVMVRQVCPLIPFDVAQSPAIHAMAEFVWREDSDLELSFSLCPTTAEDCFELLSLPPCKGPLAESSAERMDNLWRHTASKPFSPFQAHLGIGRSMHHQTETGMSTGSVPTARAALQNRRLRLQWLPAAGIGLDTAARLQCNSNPGGRTRNLLSFPCRWSLKTDAEL